MNDHGHRARPYGFYAAVGITLLAGATILSQIAASGHEPARPPEPAGSVVPVPLWTPPVQMDRSPSGQENAGELSPARVYLLLPDLTP